MMQGMSLSRRGLLVVPAFICRDDTGAELARLDFAQAQPDDEAFWRELRGLFEPPDYLAFNHAGLSPAPRAVRELLDAQTKRANADPSRAVWREQERELEPVRARLAALLGCAVDELALTPNATYGLHTAILGVAMRAGDEIVTTAHDYSRALTAMRQREQRDGTVTVQVPLATPPAAPGEVAAAILAALTPRTRLVVLSQMTYLTGQVIPVAEVAQEVAKRGIPLLVDGAHGIGLLPETFAQLGGAAYTACLHKWLMGPLGTGVFAVRADWLDKLWPLHPAEPELVRRAGKFEQWGTHAVAPFLAIAPALDLHDKLGCARKAARLQTLRARLAAELDGLSGVRQFGSLDETRARAMLTLGFAKVEARPLVDWLWREHRVHVTAVDAAGIDALRIAPNVFTAAEEVDALARVLRQVAKQGI